MMILKNAIDTLQVEGYEAVRYGTRTFTVHTPDGQTWVGVSEKFVRELATDLLRR